MVVVLRPSTAAALVFIAGLCSVIVVLRPLPAAAAILRHMHLIVVPRPMPAAPVVVFRRYLVEVPRSLPRPRRCGSRRRKTLLMCSGEE
jgi:hypothetical protein